MIHYADSDRPRVSSRGSPAKILGLKLFYHKYAPRMDDEQRRDFKARAANLFDCNEEEFLPLPNQDLTKAQTLKAWSGDLLPLNSGTLAELPKLASSTPRPEKKRVVFGVITSDIKRVSPLLDDLSAASKSQDCDFDPFIVIFANSSGNELAEEAKSQLKERRLQGHVLLRSSSNVGMILDRCNGVCTLPVTDEKLPIALSRTVLQVFIYNILPLLQNASAVCIIDDDKRLPMGWTPFTESAAEKDGADVMIGRDLR